jgi:hypothetical protein
VPQQVEADEAFSIRRENELARVAALCHTVRSVQSDDACALSHKQKVPQSHETGNVPSVPGFRSAARLPCSSLVDARWRKGDFSLFCRGWKR